MHCDVGNDKRSMSLVNELKKLNLEFMDEVVMQHLIHKNKLKALELEYNHQRSIIIEHSGYEDKQQYEIDSSLDNLFESIKNDQSGETIDFLNNQVQILKSANEQLENDLKTATLDKQNLVKRLENEREIDASEVGGILQKHYTALVESLQCEISKLKNEVSQLKNASGRYSDQMDQQSEEFLLEEFCSLKIVPSNENLVNKALTHFEKIQAKLKFR